MRTIRNILFISLGIVMPVFSQNISTGLPFLKSGTDARSAAMGEAFVAVTKDHASFFYNPATIRSAERRQLSLNHRQGFADVTTDYIGATIPSEDFTFAISAFTTSVNEIEVRLRPGDAEGTFGARNGALNTGAALSLAESWTIGLSGKLLYEKIYIDEASGYAMDGGILYALDKSIHFGASISNIGKMNLLRSAATELPTTVRLGGSYISPLSPEISILAAGDIVKTLSDDLTHFHLGAEAVYDSTFMVRAGYQTGYETRSFSAGIGFRYGIMMLDYAFVPSSGAFSAHHTFSLSFLL